MTIDEIKELIRVVQETGITELEVQRGDNRVRIRTASHPIQQEITVLPNASSPPAQASAASPYLPSATAGAGPAPADEVGANTEIVKSPIVGTYYDTPSPGAPPFVKVGDQVEPGKVLCIIESMKLMNEIEAEIAGTVAAKLVENGKPVEYGESLFAIQPR
ncbi:MAG: acetyl-CoA carboxylase biotin carboxyl carrier protein [Bryobacteraceae bacterium]